MHCRQKEIDDLDAVDRAQNPDCLALAAGIRRIRAIIQRMKTGDIYKGENFGCLRGLCTS